jgi:streptomycin 6-kinase
VVVGRAATLNQVSLSLKIAAERLSALARQWAVTLDRTVETSSSLIGFGRRASGQVVLKVVRREGDEWRSGEMLEAFAAKGLVRVLEHTGGAVLMERLSPGNSLVDVVRRGDDDEATSVLANVIGAMSPNGPPTGSPTIEKWGSGFAWYRDSGNANIPTAFVDAADETYAELCRTQKNPRLLHGDLQHSNVLFDDRRGWIAIDPKGVVGEAEYEVGALFRNPRETLDLLVDPGTIESRLRLLQSILGLDPLRMLRWVFAQAVLSAIWCIQDGEPEEAAAHSLAVATAIRRILH